ncbi:MAG: hypothetical protein WCI26_00595 [Acidimicrobiales bacterium]
MINPYFVLIALAIDAFGAIIYARQTWRGQAEPDLVSWTIWAVVPFLAFATELQQGVGIESLITFSAGAGPLLVVVVALVSNRPPWKMHPLDWLCASIAVVGVLLWLFSRNPVFGLWAFIGAQLASATPTVFKAWHEPSTESATTYVANVITSGFAIFCSAELTLATLGFPLEEMFITGLIAFLVISRIGPRLRGESEPRVDDPSEAVWPYAKSLDTHFHPEHRPHLPHHRPRYFEHSRRRSLKPPDAVEDRV